MKTCVENQVDSSESVCKNGIQHVKNCIFDTDTGVTLINITEVVEIEKNSFNFIRLNELGAENCRIVMDLESRFGQGECGEVALQKDSDTVCSDEFFEAVKVTDMRFDEVKNIIKLNELEVFTRGLEAQLNDFVLGSETGSGGGYSSKRQSFGIEV